MWYFGSWASVNKKYYAEIFVENAMQIKPPNGFLFLSHIETDPTEQR